MNVTSYDILTEFGGNIDQLNNMRLKGATPKDVRSKGSEVGTIDHLRTNLSNIAEQSLSGDAKRSMSDLLLAWDEFTAEVNGLAWNAKGKLATLLLDLYEKAAQVFKEVRAELTAEPESTEETETEETNTEDESMTEENAELNADQPTRLHEIEATIHELNSTAATALLSVGQLLNEARDEFDSAKAFLAWALDSFGFKKAYVYRLMQVAETFQPDDVLAGQSVNVLHKLAGFPEEVREAAREVVEENGKVTGREAEQLAADLTKNDTDSSADNAPASDAKPDLGQGDTGAPWDAKTGAQAGDDSTELTQVPPMEDPAFVGEDRAADNSELVELRALVTDLRAELAAARTDKPKAKPEAPHLPQFDNAALYARLGLSAEQASDGKAVRQAFRALVKAGYGSAHASHALLVEARDALLGEAKAA